jgi:polyhydroxybutyrate depolymerase
MKSLLFSCLILFCFSLKSQLLQSLNHNGITRTYTYYTPSTWTTADQLPLLVVLHGLTQTGGGVMDITQFNQLAETNNFIVCYPNGINNAWNANMNVSVSSADDKGFIDVLISQFQQNFNTNPNKQYLCGFSNGAFMSYKLACESDHCFAGIATVSGTMSDTVFTACSPSKPTSVLHIHGTADAVVPYIGSPTTGASVDQLLEKWRTIIGSPSNTTIIDFPNTNILDLSTAQKISYSSNNGYFLEHIKINGGGHQWPGISTLVGGVGTINMDFYSPQIIWDFLASKSCLTNSIVNLNESLYVYPSPCSDFIRLTGIDKETEITLTDLNGIVCQKTVVEPSNQILSLTGLAPGIYFLNYQYQTQILRIRFIKQ